MSYVVFARRWRPQDFESVIGQEPVTTTLKNAISLNRIAHAYLFSGPRGVGKTTVARIFAKALNCEKGPTTTPCNNCVSCKEIMAGSNLDILEIDGASNRGIDEIRTLRENIRFAPISARFKIYIIDEVHQITTEAFNALLKTLEEPPEHAKFIFATTQPNKVPATILSRCQRFDFKRIPLKLIIHKLQQIVKDEKIAVKEEEALFAIARVAEGSMRDAEVLLDQLNCASEGRINLKEVTEMLGMVEEELLFDVAEKILQNQTRELLLCLDGLIADGKDLAGFLNSLTEHFRSLLISKVVGARGLENILDLPKELLSRIIQQAEKFTQPRLFYILEILAHTQESSRRAVSIRTAVELALIKITQPGPQVLSGESSPKIVSQKPGLSGQAKPSLVTVKSPLYSKDSKPAAGNPPVARDNAAIVSRERPVSRIVSLTEVEAVWEKLVEEIKRYRMPYGIYLSEAKILQIEQNILTLGFSPDKNLHRETLDKPENRKRIESELDKFLKAPVMIKLITVKEESGHKNKVASDTDRTPGKQLQGKSCVDEVNSGTVPTVETISRIFGGKIIKE
jgi:DNA polymerase-3 subunit gamma/tau